jgi:RHS repeat-associated protein
VGNRLSYVKRTQTTKHPNKTDIAESAFYQYNDSNQLVSAKLFDGKKDTTVTYTYDDNGNLISEIGEYGTDQVETYYDYTVENRLQAVYDADRLLMAAAYDGDGNRVFQLNYNLHTDEDWKDNSGNGNGNNKDNAGSGNNGNGNSSSGNNGNNGNSGNNGNGNGNSGNIGNSGNGKGEGNTGNNGNSGNGNGNGNGNNKENSKSEGTDDAGYGNATNAEEHNSQNQSGILFPVAEEISRTETDLIAMIKTTGKNKDYELIEYILNVNTQYTQVLMELNENGAMDAAYTYGVSRLTEDRFTGESNFYLYDPAGNVAGITDQDGYLWQSYRYDAFGNATFGSPQYDNEYTFNAESYNPNIQSQYLRARYYDMVKGDFLTEDSYLGDIRNPLTLNRYSYCIGNPLFYDDPSGYAPRTPSSNPASPYNRIDFEARDIAWKEVWKEVKSGLKNFSAGMTAGQMEIEYGIDPVVEYIDSKIYIFWTGSYNGKSVSKEDIEYFITQQYENVDVKATSYAVGKGVSETIYYVQVLSMVSSACSMSGAGTTGAPSGDMMIAGVGGEVYIVDGTMSMPIYMDSGSTFTFFKEDSEKTEERSDSEERVYKANDGKHKGSAQGDISADPFWNNQAAGQESLNNAYSSKSTKQLYNVYNNELVKFQPDNAGTWHAYEVINPAEEVPTDVLRNMKSDGLITNSQYNKWIKGK